jgi:hypothetical protein
MEHIGALLITEENKNDFKELTKVFGAVCVKENIDFIAPNLFKIEGALMLRDGACMIAKELSIVTGVIVGLGHINSPYLTKGQNK